jgi:hypothetical protein
MTADYPQLVATDTLFYHDSDERAFVEWVERMSFVQDSYGVGRSMFLRFSRFPTDTDLWELIGFCRRYRIDMTQLAAFLTEEYRPWFFNPDMAWFTEVFGSERVPNSS